MVLTYANILTILRMLFVPVFVILLVYGHPRAATVLFLFAAVTDGLDGLLARKLQQKTVLGSFLDPMADKILLTAAFITLTIPSVPLILHIPTWLTVLTISRDVIIASSALVIHLQTQHSSFPPSLLGKCTTAVQLLTVGVCMLANFESALATTVFPFVQYATLAFTVASGLHYAYRSVRIIASYQVQGNDPKRDQNS
ncbi:MAG TPA: CDP-alcohol phosphatidyltransferase family protein [Acidobacteriota bacterium]|nr:CDP-alcohol phosphatidyltransferase family protein [Acidobacteriota bacterium]